MPSICQALRKMHKEQRWMSHSLTVSCSQTRLEADVFITNGEKL